MKKLAKSLGAFLIAFSLIGCGSNDVPTTDTTPTVENFNSDKYDLKIKSKYQSVGGKLDLSGGKKQHIRAARRLAVNNGVAEASGNSMVLSIDDEGIQTLMQLDPDLDVNSTGQAARILTAPEKSTLVEVVGTEKESTPANNAEGGESSDNSVVAPSKFQMVEYDANGTYGIDIGSDVYQKLDLSIYANGVIQPRSIKTKDFTFSDSTMNFATARSDVYFIKDGDYDGMSAERPYELNIETYRLTDYETKVKPELYYAAHCTLFGYGKAHSQGNVQSKFFTEVTDLDNLNEGIHKITISCESENHKFRYSSELYINLKYTDNGYPILCPKPGVTMVFDYQSPEFIVESGYAPAYGYSFTNYVEVITRDYTKEENMKRLKDNYDIYMSTDLDKTTNLIDSAVLYTLEEAPKYASPSSCDWILGIGNFYYYIR